MRAPDKKPADGVAYLTDRADLALEVSQCLEPSKADLALKATRFFIAVGPEAFARTGEIGDYNDAAATVDALVKRYVEGTSAKLSDPARIHLADALRSGSGPLYSAALAVFHRAVGRALERMRDNDRAGAGRELWDLDAAVQSMSIHAHAEAGLLPDAQRGEKTRAGGAAGRAKKAERLDSFWATLPATVKNVCKSHEYTSNTALAVAVRAQWRSDFRDKTPPRVDTIRKRLPKLESSG